MGAQARRSCGSTCSARRASRMRRAWRTSTCCSTWRSSPAWRWPRTRLCWWTRCAPAAPSRRATSSSSTRWPSCEAAPCRCRMHGGRWRLHYVAAASACVCVALTCLISSLVKSQSAFFGGCQRQGGRLSCDSSHCVLLDAYVQQARDVSKSHATLKCSTQKMSARVPLPQQPTSDLSTFKSRHTEDH